MRRNRRSLPTLFSYNNLILFLIPTGKKKDRRRIWRGWGMYVSRESRSRRLSQHTAMSNVMLSRYQSILIGRFIDLITYSCETSNPWFVKTHTAAPNPQWARRSRDKDTDTERDGDAGGDRDRATRRVSAQDLSLISGTRNAADLYDFESPCGKRGGFWVGGERLQDLMAPRSLLLYKVHLNYHWKVKESCCIEISWKSKKKKANIAF